MNYDVIIIGAGISGLSCAIELNKQNQNQQKNISICVLEKSVNLGGNILSGCLFNPRAINQLLPNWQQVLNFYPELVNQEETVLLTKYGHKILSKKLHNKGNYIISLSQLVYKLGTYAQSLGIDIITSTAVTDVIFDDNKKSVIGVKTGDLGVNTVEHQAGYSLYSKQIILAEGVRGYLTKKIIKHFKLDKFSSAQTYALGIKEIWSVTSNHTGFISHTLGYPLSYDTYGGGFLYGLNKNTVALGFVTGLDYSNPYFDPYLKFQEFKKHSYINKIIANGTCLEYGAKTITEGGIQSLPQLTFAGGLLIGESAGFVNVASLKGADLAIQSGMLAAQAVAPNLSISNSKNIRVNNYNKLIKKSFIYQELYKIRNIRPAFNKGLILGLIYYLLEKYLFKHKVFWTLHNNMPDYKKTKTIQQLSCPQKTVSSINDKIKSILLSNINYSHQQNNNLIIKNKQLIYDFNQKLYAHLETRYCPAGVYNIVNNKLIINSQNCLHCKACDIKDPKQNIEWTPAEGGSGPNYSLM